MENSKASRVSKGLYISQKEFVNGEYVNSLLANLGEGQSLLVYGTKIQSGLRLPDNIVVKKIPKDLLDKCTFESEVK